MYIWRHKKVLEVVKNLLRALCEAANQLPVTAKELIIQFCEETKKNFQYKATEWS